MKTIESLEEELSQTRKELDRLRTDNTNLQKEFGAILLELRIMNKQIKDWTTPSYGNFAVNDYNKVDDAPPPPPPIPTRKSCW